MDNFSCVCYDESRKLPQYSDRIRIFDGILLKPVRKGTFMNYFLYTSKYTDLHYEESKKYITQQYQNGDLVKVSFNDENYVDYMRDSGGLEVIKDSVIYLLARMAIITGFIMTARKRAKNTRPECQKG